jgi:hypothetical protein
MDLRFLRTLYENPGDGYVSVYLDTTPSESAATEIGLRWRSARERLTVAGADDATLDAAAPAVTEQAPGGGRTVFASGGAVRLSDTLPRPPLRELASYAPLPHVMPWLAQRPPHVPHVRVTAGRAGGQVVAVSGAGTSGAAAVRGQSWPVHKVSSGGWAEQRLQRSAEETWADNAKRIADVAAAAADEVHAGFVVVGGDVRERQMVIGLLPAALRDAVVAVDREVGPETAPFDEAARAEAVRLAERESRARLAEFRVRISGAEPGARRAVEGLGDTLTALRDGLASDVLVAGALGAGALGDGALGDGALGDGDPSAPATVWIGPGLADAAAGKEELLARGVARPVTDRADAALVRAVAGTDAELHFLPADTDQPRDGVAALLRAPAAALLRAVARSRLCRNRTGSRTSQREKQGRKRCLTCLRSCGRTTKR